MGGGGGGGANSSPGYKIVLSLAGTWICPPIVAFSFFYWIKITMPPLVLFIIPMHGTPCKYEARENLILGLTFAASIRVSKFFPKKYYF
jgi:hypothetical protein